MVVKLDQALVQAFIGGAFGLPIAYENEQYAPVSGTPYAELRVFLNPERAFTLANKNDITGIFQAILNYPADIGSIEAKEMADTISAAYPIGLNLTYSGQSLQITERQRARAAPVNGWYRLALRFNFVAYLPR